MESHGTLTLADLQATVNASTVARVGLDVTFGAIANTLAAHNAILAEMFADLVERTTDESRRYGGDDTMTMEDLDELGIPRAQKVTAGATVGFPLNASGIGVQWSEMWFRKHTIEELAAQMNAVMSADIRRVTRDLKRALFYSSNYTFTDHLGRGIDLAVKRLVNGDGAVIPPGPYGTTFDGATHTHLIPTGTGTLAAGDLTNLVNTVREHYTTGELRVYINSAQESAVTALTGFVGYQDPRLTLSVNTTTAQGRPLDVVNTYNRALGLFGGAEIWVKPWVPAGYAFAFNATAPKPLAYRFDPDYGDGLVPILADGSPATYPWNARAWRRVFGVGVWNRINGAALITGASSWSDPTIN